MKRFIIVLSAISTILIGQMLSYYGFANPHIVNVDTIKNKPDILTGAYVIFGIPRTTDNEWDGGHILLITVTITLNDGTKFTSSQEHRNTDVKKSRAINLPLPYSEQEKSRITFDNIAQINIKVFSFPGKPTGSDGNQCVCREEAVLTFLSGKNILSGYDDAKLLLPLAPKWKIETNYYRKGFEYNFDHVLVDTKVP